MQAALDRHLKEKGHSFSIINDREFFNSRKVTFTRNVHDKRLSNHSLQKTVVRKLKAKGVPKSEIITITGHRQEQSVEAYDSGNTDKQRKPSNMIYGREIQFNHTTGGVPLQPLIQSSAAVSSGHVYNFHNCNVVINQGQANASSSLL